MDGDVLGLCGGEGSGLAGLSGTTFEALRGDTHLERDEGGELPKLLVALFRERERPLGVAPVDGPEMSSMTCLWPRDVLGRTVTGLLTAGSLSGAVAVADALVGNTGMTGTIKSGLPILTPENVGGGVWLVVALSSWGRPGTNMGSSSTTCSLGLSRGSSTDRVR